MPVIKRPRTNNQRNLALTKAKERKDVSPPAEIPFTPATTTRIDTFQPTYQTLITAVINALVAQTGITELVNSARISASYFISDMIEAMQRAVRRSTFTASVRGYYDLPVSKPLNPEIRTEEQVLEWGPKVITGETNRVAAGGAPITFPGLPEVQAAYESFRTQNLQQASYKTAYDNAQEAVAAQNAEADKLILKMWNETETFFDEGDKPSMRRKAREWGVMYVPSPGETPSPEDYSIIGKVTAQATGLPLEDVAVKVIETDEAYLSDADGDYFIPVLPAATYSLEVSKPGFASQTLPGIVVTEGVITELDIVLTPAASTGSATGIVTAAGVPTPGIAISVDGVPLPTVFTNPAGQYSISGIPAGMQTLRAQLPPAMGGGFLIQNVNVVAGSEVNVDFSF